MHSGHQIASEKTQHLGVQNSDRLTRGETHSKLSGKRYDWCRCSETGSVTGGR